MKPIYQLRQSQKARLVHALFPEQIPALLDYFSIRCQQLDTQHQEIRSSWNDPIYSADHYIDCIGIVKGKLKKNSERFSRSPSLFASNLFNGHNAAFCVGLLRDYVRDKPAISPKFAMAIQLFFYP